MPFIISGLPERLKNGIAAICGFGLLNTDSELVITAEKSVSVSVAKAQNQLKRFYDTEPHFYFALFEAFLLPDGEKRLEFKLKRLGVMLDCSRNAVMRPNEIKRLICVITILGYTDGIHFEPRIPKEWEEYILNFAYKGAVMKITVNAGKAVFELISGGSLEFKAYGNSVALNKTSAEYEYSF